MNWYKNVNNDLKQERISIFKNRLPHIQSTVASDFKSRYVLPRSQSEDLPLVPVSNFFKTKVKILNKVDAKQLYAEKNFPIDK